MNNDANVSSGHVDSSDVVTPVTDGPNRQLPTLQSNALRKVFDRPEFTPEEVAALGYQRLQRADGIGHKGLLAISAWLEAHGLHLAPPPAPSHPPVIEEGAQKDINGAVRLLRQHGYRVQRIKNSRSAGGL